MLRTIDRSPLVEFIDFVESQPRQSVRQLLDKILLKSRLMTGAEAGTIFIMRRSGRRRWLESMSAQNDAVKVTSKSFTVPIPSRTIAGYVADTGATLIIDDVYDIEGRAPYAFDSRFERKGFRTRSMMCFPLKDYQDQIIGVVQIINRKVEGVAEPQPFADAHAELIRPVSRAVATHVERADMLERIRKKNVALRQRNRTLREQQVRIAHLQEETEESFMLSINLLARAAELHDEDTGDHIIRVNEYSYFVARTLDMPAGFCDEIHYSAQLHDVGKMSVDAAILHKPGRLTAAEIAEMGQHPTYGNEILKGSPRLAMAAEIAWCHHEKWDGTGYPRGLAGAEIPIAARIVALADVYDALRSKRSYKPAFSHEKSLDILTNGDDRIDPANHFGPDLVEIVKAHHQGMAEIYLRLHD